MWDINKWLKVNFIQINIRFDTIIIINKQQMYFESSM